MNIKILTPDKVVFDGEVSSILLPGKNGDFHIMKDHTAIVAALSGGKLKIYTPKVDEAYQSNFTKEKEKESVFSFKIKSGVIEFSNNKGIVLAE